MPRRIIGGSQGGHTALLVVKDVQGMSQEVLNIILAGIAAFTGVVGIWLSIQHHRQRTKEREEDHRLAEEQLKLAQEQAELRPNLAVSFREVIFHYRPPNPGSEYVQAGIVFDIANNGRSAAHNVRCEIRLDEQRLVLDDTHGPNQIFFEPHIGPLSGRVYQRNVAIHAYGLTKAHYRCVCDEVGETEGQIEFEVPEKEQT
jgi:hypothetical protein